MLGSNLWSSCLSLLSLHAPFTFHSTNICTCYMPVPLHTGWIITILTCHIIWSHQSLSWGKSRHPHHRWGLPARGGYQDLCQKTRCTYKRKALSRYTGPSQVKLYDRGCQTAVPLALQKEPKDMVQLADTGCQGLLLYTSFSSINDWSFLPVFLMIIRGRHPD